MTLKPLLLFLLGGAALAQDNACDDARPLSLPGAVGLDVRWEGLRDDALDAATVQGLLQEDTDGSNVVTCGERQYASLWSAVDRRLAQDPRDATAAYGKKECFQASLELVRQLLAKAGLL